MAYAPGGYGGAPEQRTAFAESAIPLILIAVLAIFIAGKVGVVDLRGVPVVGSLFPAANIRVAVIGRASPELQSLMVSDDYVSAGVLYAGDYPQNTLSPGVLNQFDVIVLQGEQFCDRTARRVIADRVKAGGKLIVVGDACTKTHEDPAACGWDIGVGLLGDVMPATVCGVTAQREPIRTFYTQGSLRIVEISHPVFSGITNFPFRGYVTEVLPRSGFRSLARIDEGRATATAPALHAILESGSLVGGKVIYFAFDPGTTSRNMFLNTILYLKGTRG